MNGEKNFVDEVKTSMGLVLTRGFTKGISGDDIANYLRRLVAQYKEAGKIVKYTWKKIEGSRKGGERGFNGSHVKRVMKRKSGTYVLFGKAAWNNKPRAQMMKWLSPKKMTESKRYRIYATKADGTRRADHAVSIKIGDEGKHLYDNKFTTNKKKIFCAAALALSMEDISNCYVFNIRV